MKRIIGALSALFVFSASGAHADGLPAATAYSDASLSGGSAETTAYAQKFEFGPNNISVSGLGSTSSGGGFVSGSVNVQNVAGPVPYTSNTVSVSAPVSYDIYGRQNTVEISGGGNTNMTYWGEVVGPASPTPVLIDMRANLSANISGGGQPWAAVFVQGTGLYGPDGTLGGEWYWQAVANDFGDPSTSTTLSPRPTMQVMVSQPFEIILETGTSAGASNGPGVGTPNPSSFASAYADPYFSVDASTPNAGLYSFLFSDGVGNSLPSAPSPASGVGGLSLGFLALLRLATKRRKTQSF